MVRMDADLEELQKKTEIINRKRKLDQEGSYEKLSSMNWQTMELQMKNYQIEVGPFVVMLSLENMWGYWRKTEETENERVTCL